MPPGGLGPLPAPPSLGCQLPPLAVTPSLSPSPLPPGPPSPPWRSQCHLDLPLSSPLRRGAPTITPFSCWACPLWPGWPWLPGASLTCSGGPAPSRARDAGFRCELGLRLRAFPPVGPISGTPWPGFREGDSSAVGFHPLGCGSVLEAARGQPLGADDPSSPPGLVPVVAPGTGVCLALRLPEITCAPRGGSGAFAEVGSEGKERGAAQGSAGRTSPPSHLRYKVVTSADLLLHPVPGQWPSRPSYRSPGLGGRGPDPCPWPCPCRALLAGLALPTAPSSLPLGYPGTQALGQAARWVTVSRATPASRLTLVWKGALVCVVRGPRLWACFAAG